MSKKTITILCKDKGLHGKKINMPIDGEVEISEEGTVEVSEEVAELLVGDGSPWSFEEIEEEEEIEKEKPKTSTKKADKAEKVKEEEEEEEEEDDEDEVLKEIKENLNKLTLEELLAMAKKAKYKVEEYKNFKTNKKLMVAYLFKKATEESN